jgi:glycosyltransferase involved in cell wall biosynthesis
MVPHGGAASHERVMELEPPSEAAPGRLDRSKARTRVWVFSELYYPEQTSTGYFLTRIAEGLVGDFEVHAVCSQPTYSSRGVVAPYREQRNGVEIERCRSTRLDKDVLLFRLLNLATFAVAVLTKALRNLRRNDLALVVTNPPTLPYIVRMAAAVRGARVLLVVHDVFPEALVAAGMVRRDSLVVRIWSGLSRRLYRSMDRIVVLGRDMQTLVGQRLSASDRRLRIIPNWGDTEGVKPSVTDGDRVRARLGLERRFIVQFMGNMGRTHGMEALVEAAAELQDEPDVHFMLMGWGARRGWLESEVSRRDLKNVTVLPGCSQDELSAHFNACDLAVIPFVPGMAGISVPSRMYNVMAAGKPILAVADAESELALVIEEENIGWVVPANRPEDLAKAIRNALFSRGDLKAMGMRARCAAEQKYSIGVVAERYRELCAELQTSTVTR